jgi:hypothetical protein
VLHTKYYFYNPIKENETGGSNDPYEGEEKCIQSFDVDTCRWTLSIDRIISSQTFNNRIGWYELD